MSELRARRRRVCTTECPVSSNLVRCHVDCRLRDLRPRVRARMSTVPRRWANSRFCWSVASASRLAAETSSAVASRSLRRSLSRAARETIRRRLHDWNHDGAFGLVIVGRCGGGRSSEAAAHSSDAPIPASTNCLPTPRCVFDRHPRMRPEHGPQGLPHGQLADVGAAKSRSRPSRRTPCRGRSTSTRCGKRCEANANCQSPSPIAFGVTGIPSTISGTNSQLSGRRKGHWPAPPGSRSKLRCAA